MKKTVKDRVFFILAMAINTESDFINYIGKDTYSHLIRVRNGYVCQSVFCNPDIVGSTCGKRRLRELRTELSNKYIFEMRRKDNRVEYRIRPRPKLSKGVQLVCL